MPAPDAGPDVIELTEYQSEPLSQDRLPFAAALTLVQRYSSQVHVERPIGGPSDWVATPQGWVGYIPLTEELGISLQPKVPLQNLFRMLEVAYSLESFKFLDDLFGAQTLNDFYERLAKLLAQHVLNRFRKGIHRSYEPFAEQLPYLRGSIDMAQISRRPWQIHLPCSFEEHTADMEDNQILASALQRILRSGLCTEKSMRTVHAAYRNFRGLVTPNAFRARDCIHRQYSRLNSDYHPMHALCYFFLDDSGPSHQIGERTMLPFLVNMARLYEQFVAGWMRANLPEELSVHAQERHDIDTDAGLHFDLDLVIRDSQTDEVRWVLDTKYKAPSGGPSASDIAQVVAYAEAKQTTEAILIYPVPLPKPLDQRIGNIRVRSLTFALDGDLDEAGHRFRAALLSDGVA